MDFGLRLSKSNNNVTDSLEKMLVDSGYPLFKRFVQGSGILSTTAGNGGATVEISHNLGYKPSANVSGKIPYGSNKYKEWSLWDYQGLQLGDTYEYYPDTNKLYIKVELCSLSDTVNRSFSYDYIIFYDEATL